MRRPLVIVPAFNEEGNVAASLEGLKGLDVDVLVIDDGSDDRTAEVATSCGATVVSFPVNLGIGAALQAGFRYAVDRGYTLACQYDADGQHVGSEIPKLLEPVRNGDADFCIGSRFSSGGDPYRVGFVRRRVMKFLAGWISRMVGRRLSDVSSGFRAFGDAALRHFAVEYPHDYMESVEALVIAARAGLRIEEVPVVMQERALGESSARTPLAAYKTLRMAISVLLVRVFDTKAAS